MSKAIVIQVGEGKDKKELKFNVDMGDFERYQNEFMPNSKVAPSKNFLNRVVADDSKDDLDALIKQGYAVELAQLVVGEARPQVELTVKPASATATK